MLVLLAGATGNLGQKLIQSLHDRGHQVRALGRDPSKLNATLQEKLESFVEFNNYYDIEALERGCHGVDAVVCAYNGVPGLHLDGQLLLLRAAERAGVSRYVAATWNCDWRDMTLGMHESYDPIMCFREQVKLSSIIKPIYFFCGAFAEVFFSVPGHGDFSPANHGVWDPESKTMDIWGSEDQVWQLTTERDAAEFTAEIVGRDDVSQGGYWCVCSGEYSLKDIAAVYEKVRGRKVHKQHQGSVEELRATALEARKKGSKQNFYEYIGYFYQLYTYDGTWTLKASDNDKLRVEVTSLERFLQENPSV
ncbi:hypothetical protein VTI74DRAFT_10328 [Chaetomium olivicolor]